VEEIKQTEQYNGFFVADNRDVAPLVFHGDSDKLTIGIRIRAKISN